MLDIETLGEYNLALANYHRCEIIRDLISKLDPEYFEDIGLIDTYLWERMQDLAGFELTFIQSELEVEE